MKNDAVVVRPRIDLIDALRGFALVGLFVVHCVEHFELGGRPEHTPAWLRALDGQVHDAVFSLFSGKAYGIFAALFGLSFFIQLDAGARRGEDLRARFLWRLTLLAALGYVNGLWYCGDILMVIAVLGLPLVALYRMSDRALGWLAAVFLLGVPAWWVVGRVLFDGHVPAPPTHWPLYGKYCAIYASGSFGEVLAANATGAQSLRFLFTYESGRYLQMFGLFLCGLLVGRSRVLEDPARAVRFGWRALVLGGIAFAAFWPVAHWINSFAATGVARYTVSRITGSWIGTAQIAVMVGGFTLLYQTARAGRWLKPLAGYGRMSLTGYMTQGLFWVPLYYGFGFGLHNKLGATVSVLIGLPFLVAHIAAANWWLRRFRYGPLEWFWRACTLRSFAIPLRRAAAAPVVPTAEPAALAD
ncbi:MAG: DUF418 domain-containing protein [Opitutaceae bacterium]